MQIIECEQGTPEWDRIRGMIPTASKFDKILSPTGKPSTQNKQYMNELLSHWIMGHGDLGEGFVSPWMELGTATEETARAFYEVATGNDVTEVGFCLGDDERAGCSPDGLIGDAGGIEIKCPKGSTHVGYLKGQKLPTGYIPQVQGSLLVTGRLWWDFVSYHTEIAPLIIRVYRDNDYIAKLSFAIEKFYEQMIAQRLNLMELGYGPKTI